MDKKVFKNLIKLAAVISAVIGIWWMLRCQCASLKSLNPASIKGYLHGFGNLSPLVYILAYALNTVSIFPPIAILSLSAGFIFGKIPGAIFLMLGAMLGTSATFFISRIFARDLVAKLIRGKLKELDDLLVKRGFLTIIFFRAIPLVPYEVLNYAGGLSKIKFRDYFFATFIGLIPGVVISAFFGGSLSEIKGFKDLFSFKFALALGALILIMLMPVIYRYLKKRRG